MWRGEHRSFCGQIHSRAPDDDCKANDRAKTMTVTKMVSTLSTNGGLRAAVATARPRGRVGQQCKPSCSSPARLREARVGVGCRASSKGFGLGTGTQKSSKVPPGFKKVADDMGGKSSKAVLLGTLNLILYEFEDQLYCSEANSTAYKYPLIDGEIKRTEDGVVSIETPLDGTTYDLTTGAVLEWCPKNNLLRNFLGGLKEKEKPVPLRVYPVVIGADGIYTKYSSPAA